MTLEQKMEAVLRRIVKAADEHGNQRREEHEWYAIPPGYIDAARDTIEQLDLMDAVLGKKKGDAVVFVCPNCKPGTVLECAECGSKHETTKEVL